jgi:hypothetical protein
MTTGSRLRRLEQALPPQVAARLWLAEAHAHGSYGAYDAWLDEQPPDQEPHRRVRAQAEAATWAGFPQGAGEAPLAAAQAGRDAVFLVELVKVLNDQAAILLLPGFHRVETLEAELRLLFLEVRSGVSAVEGPDGGTCAERWISWCLALLTLAFILNAAQAARTFLEERYLGMSALFPDLAVGWAQLLRRVEELVDLAVAGPSAREGDRAGAWPPDRRALVVLTPEAQHEGAQRHFLSAAADLVDDAQARTLARFGDRQGVATIVARRMRRQAGPGEE